MGFPKHSNPRLRSALHISGDGTALPNILASTSSPAVMDSSSAYIESSGESPLSFAAQQFYAIPVHQQAPSPRHLTFPLPNKLSLPHGQVDDRPDDSQSCATSGVERSLPSVSGANMMIKSSHTMEVHTCPHCCVRKRRHSSADFATEPFSSSYPELSRDQKRAFQDELADQKLALRLHKHALMVSTVGSAIVAETLTDEERDAFIFKHASATCLGEPLNTLSRCGLPPSLTRLHKLAPICAPSKPESSPPNESIVLSATRSLGSDASALESLTTDKPDPPCTKKLSLSPFTKPTDPVSTEQQNVRHVLPQRRVTAPATTIRHKRPSSPLAVESTEVPANSGRRPLLLKVHSTPNTRLSNTRIDLLRMLIAKDVSQLANEASLGEAS